MKKLKLINLPTSLDFLITKKHPWIYRNKFKPYSKNLKDGDFLNLKTENSKRESFGIYASEGLVAVRIFSFESDFSFIEKLEKSILKRKTLLKETNSIRLIHGENDGIPGINIDLHNDSVVIMYYSSSLQLVARYISKLLSEKIEDILGVKIVSIQLNPPNRTGKEKSISKTRHLLGLEKEFTKIRYFEINYKINLQSQKSGIYNDIRNLRRYLCQNKDLIDNKRVLNLFSSNGLLSKLIEIKKASQVVSVEDSGKILQVHEMNSGEKSIELSEYTKSDKKQILIKYDILKNINALFKPLDNFDLIIIDPPSLTNSDDDKEKARKIYINLIGAAIKNLNQNGTLILCSCSNRIHSNDFERIGRETLRENHLKFTKLLKLNPEIDHPVVANFPEGDYFKVHIYNDIYSL